MVENLRDALLLQWREAEDNGGTPITHHILQYSTDSVEWHITTIPSAHRTYLV